MANIFKEAKKIQKQHPRLTWQQSIQKASKAHKKVGAVKKKKTKFRQTGSSSKLADEVRHAKRPGKRKSASGKTYYERRKNRTDVPFSLTGIKSQAKEKLAKALLDYDLADTIKATKEARARVVKYRKVLKSL
jgi:hypothetical protein